MGGSNKKTIEEKKEMALNYLNEKYDDRFTAKGFESKSWAYDYDSIMFYSDKYSEIVYVRLYENGGVVSFQDSYFAICMKDQANVFFANIAKDYGIQSATKVEFINEYEMSENSADSFEHYVQSNSCEVEACYLSANEFSIDSITTFLAKVSSTNVSGIFRFFQVKDIALAESMSFSDIMNDKDSIICASRSFKVDQNGYSQMD